MSKAEVLKRITELESELADLRRKLSQIELDEKPFEAVIYGYSSPGRSSTFFKTEEQARKKYEEYSRKSYYRSGLVYGAVLYRHNDDGTKTRLDYVEKVHYWKCPKEAFE